jgi:uncharacterized coiled-coil protein SlyX
MPYYHQKCRQITDEEMCRRSHHDDGTNPMKSCFSTKYAINFSKNEIDSATDTLEKLEEKMVEQMRNIDSQKEMIDFQRKKIDSMTDALKKLEKMPQCSTIGNAVKRFWGDKNQDKTFDEFLDFQTNFSENHQVNECLFKKIANDANDKISFVDYKNKFDETYKVCIQE